MVQSPSRNLGRCGRQSREKPPRSVRPPRAAGGISSAVYDGRWPSVELSYGSAFSTDPERRTAETRSTFQSYIQAESYQSRGGQE